MSYKLKIGVIVNEDEISNWKLSTIQCLLKLHFIEVDIIYLKFKTKNKDSRFSLTTFIMKRFYEMVSCLERFLFSEIGPNAFCKLPLNSTIKLKGENIFHNSEECLNYIESVAHDILINFGIYKIPNKYLEIPRFGLWEIYSGSNFISNNFKGLKEVFERENVQLISLRKLEKNGDPNSTLSQSFSQVDKINLLRNNNSAFWKAPHIIERKVKEIYNTNNLIIESTFHTPHIESFEKTLFAKYILLIPWRYTQFFIKRFLGKFFFDQWILMYRFNESKVPDFTFNEFKKILPPKDRIWADPFVIKKNAEYYIFIEEMLLAEGKGFISCLKIDKEGNTTKPKKIIEKDYHMSYPFLFEDQGELFMIPETNQNKTIQIYKCIEFPNKWDFVLNIMEDIEAVDTTILFKDNKYWLFTNIRENQGIPFEDELFVFSSDKLLSTNWNIHPMSPVKSDVRSARPAGGIIVNQEVIYRPSQNCSKHYGYGLNFSKITKLTADSYLEEISEQVHPTWKDNIVSIHTYNQAKGIVVVDAELRRIRNFNWFNKM